MSPPRWALMIVLVAAAVLAFVIPWSKDFFMLQLPDELSDFAGVAIVVPIAWVILEVVWRWVDRRLAGHEA
ncbi:MAG: hypothetical protein R2690_09540 [Acidimicrobiales bacterium]